MKSILLTGASSGIGNEVLKLLMAQGSWNVVTVGRRIPQIPGRFDHITCDLSQAMEVEELLNRLRKEDKVFFGLINCAGLGRFSNLEEMSPEAWNEMISVNLTAPYALTRFVLPGMKERGMGRIINISSDADNIGFPGATGYCASKFGIRGFSEALRKELVGSGVLVTTISPGRVDTCFNGKEPGMRPHSLAANDVAQTVLAVLAIEGRCEIEVIRMKSNLE